MTDREHIRRDIAQRAEAYSVPAFATPLWQAHHARQPFGIDRATAVMLDDGRRTTWGEFLVDNHDGIVAGDVDPERLAHDLLKRPGCTSGRYG